MQNNTGASYLTAKDLTNDYRRDNIQSQIQNRLNGSHQIVVNRTELIANTNGPSGGGGGFPQGSTKINPQVMQKLNGNRDTNLKKNVAEIIQQAYSDIDFNNFDIAYTKISQAIKMLEQS